MSIRALVLGLVGIALIALSWKQLANHTEMMQSDGYETKREVTHGILKYTFSSLAGVIAFLIAFSLRNGGAV